MKKPVLAQWHIDNGTWRKSFDFTSKEESRKD
jgi:hypothetical protein